MSLMGIDIGTTGCKASVFDLSGRQLAQAYREYDIVRPRPGWQELDAVELWTKVKAVVAEVAAKTAGDPIEAFSVSSFGEAMTPVSRDRRILGNCILGLDERGREYIPDLEREVGREPLYRLNGNLLDYQYSMPKLMWLRDQARGVYDQADKFLLCADLIYYMMGCDAVTDYSLANRTLLLDIRARQWSDVLLSASGLTKEKLPSLAQAGTDLGTISPSIAKELGLRPEVRAVVGGHDQCCNALGAGVAGERTAAYGIGTFACITPVYSDVPDPGRMMENGMNVEDHVVEGLYVSFLYNASGGSVVKWFRDTMAQLDRERMLEAGQDVYSLLMEEMPSRPSNLMVLPHFASTGPPYFAKETSGVIAGLTLGTGRGEILKGLIEGVTYYVKDGLECMERAGICVDELRPTGGGAKSAAWLQLTADIMGIPLAKPRVSEAGTLGAAILAGTGIGVFASAYEGATQCVSIERVFEPDSERHRMYERRMDIYRQIYPVLKPLLRDIARLGG